MRAAGASSENGEIKVWDAETGQELQTLPAGGGTSVTFSPDGRRIAGAGKRPIDSLDPQASGEVKMWDAQTGRLILRFRDLNISLNGQGINQRPTLINGHLVAAIGRMLLAFPLP